MVLVRAFDRARSLAARFPRAGLERLPERVDGATDGARFYRVSPDGKTFTATPVNFDRVRMVAVVDPSCHFSEDALQEIGGDKELSAWVANHALLVFPQRNGLALDEVVAWNAAHPSLPYVYAVAQADWHVEVDWSATPGLYLLRNGAVVRRVAMRDLRATTLEQ